MKHALIWHQRSNEIAVRSQACIRTLIGATLLLIGAGTPLLAQTWQLESTPGSSDFNGVSIGSDGFAVLVGNGGEIIHRDPDGSYSMQSSGTAQDLFDVYVADASFAVAMGMDVGLLWDGSSWQTFLSTTTNTLYTSVWVPPEKNATIFNYQDGPLVFHQVYEPDTDQLSLPAVSGFDIAYCGGSNDIKTITQNGSVANFRNDLLPAHQDQGTSTLLFDNSPQGRLFTAAWIRPVACMPGSAQIMDAFAINLGRVFYRFTPNQGWTEMPVQGGVLPADHNLNWLGGTGTNNIVAVGFRPVPGGGNEGIVWRFDGTIWKQDTSLPPGTPGLGDIAITHQFFDKLFGNGFETSVRRGSSIGGPTQNGFGVDVLAAAESGTTLHNDQLFPSQSADLEVRMALEESPPFSEMDMLTYDLTLINRGPPTTALASVIPHCDLTMDAAFDCDSILFVSNSCGSERQSPVDIGAGQIAMCTVKFTIDSFALNPPNRLIIATGQAINQRYQEENTANNFSRVEVGKD